MELLRVFWVDQGTELSLDAVDVGVYSQTNFKFIAHIEGIRALLDVLLDVGLNPVPVTTASVRWRIHSQEVL